MSEEDKAVETIIMHKANKMIKSKKLTLHIEEFLDWRGINSGNIPVDVFKICAVDAMIFDVGAASDFAEFKRPQRRRKLLEKIFPKPLPTNGE